jgi:hypothetical protein
MHFKNSSIGSVVVYPAKTQIASCLSESYLLFYPFHLFGRMPVTPKARRTLPSIQEGVYQLQLFYYTSNRNPYLVVGCQGLRLGVIPTALPTVGELHPSD